MRRSIVLGAGSLALTAVFALPLAQFGFSFAAKPCPTTPEISATSSVGGAKSTQAPGPAPLAPAMPYVAPTPHPASATTTGEATGKSPTPAAEPLPQPIASVTGPMQTPSVMPVSTQSAEFGTTVDTDRPTPHTPIPTATILPDRIETDFSPWIVQASCSAAVLDSPGGQWVLSAAHCGAPTSVRTASTTFNVLSYLPFGIGEAEDLALIKVNGDIKANVNGGFKIGSSPAAGTLINVYGYPLQSKQLTGCSGVPVQYDGIYPQIEDCYLPSGTSGGPWYTYDGYLHGVIGGLDEGGADDYTTNTIPFTPAVVSWLNATTR